MLRREQRGEGGERGGQTGRGEAEEEGWRGREGGEGRGREAGSRGKGGKREERGITLRNAEPVLPFVWCSG